MNEIFSYEMLEELGAAFSTGEMIYNVTLYILGIAAYVLRSLSLYTIAKRRGISNPWLAWVPVAWVWVLGSISDQFRYVTKAQVKNKRTTLLVMELIGCVLSVIVVVIAVMGAIDIIDTAMVASEEEMLREGMAFFFKCMGLCLALAAFALATAIIRYMALYDLYMSVNPANAVLFLVLGIIISITEPFFLFFNRKKDDGMPPRCDVPQEPVSYSYIPVTSAVEPQIPEIEPAAEDSEEL